MGTPPSGPRDAGHGCSSPSGMRSLSRPAIGASLNVEEAFLLSSGVGVKPWVSRLHCSHLPWMPAFQKAFGLGRLLNVFYERSDNLGVP